MGRGRAERRSRQVSRRILEEVIRAAFVVLVAVVSVAILVALLRRPSAPVVRGQLAYISTSTHEQIEMPLGYRVEVYPDVAILYSQDGRGVVVQPLSSTGQIGIKLDGMSADTVRENAPQDQPSDDDPAPDAPAAPNGD